MADPYSALGVAYDRALTYRRSVPGRPCAPRKGFDEMLAIFDEPLPEHGKDADAVINELADRGEKGLTHMVHPKFFGWVLGGSAPVGVAADWLVSAWGQNSAFHRSTPTTAAVEQIAAGWLLDILDLPRDAAVGFVTGGTVGNFTALAAARGAVLRAQGWDPDEDGLFGAPPITVYLGDDAHTSVMSALGYLGLGRNRVKRVQTDAEGRMVASDLAQQMGKQTSPAIIVTQAGQINTGAFDPFDQIADIAEQTGAWIHVDGAFGLWARVHPDYRALTNGLERADSWSVDGHKWLQTPFDSGYAIVRDKDALQKAMRISASYLPPQAEHERIPCFLTPELSRRARGLPTWAMLKSLGRKGVQEMVGRHCRTAARIAARLRPADGVHVLNEVALNQIIVSFGTDGADPQLHQTATEAVIARIVEKGEIFVGGSQWRGDWVMRISVISNDTEFEAADRIADHILEVWDEVRKTLIKSESPAL